MCTDDIVILYWDTQKKKKTSVNITTIVIHQYNTDLPGLSSIKQQVGDHGHGEEKKREQIH